MSEITILSIIVLIIIFCILYTFLFYPGILFLLSKIFKNPYQSDPGYQPEITILLSAYNEEKLIVEAIESVFNNGYPNEKIHLIIGSDGSTDNTNNILVELKAKYINIDFYLFNRIGKNAVLNHLITKAKTELVFFMDADSRIMPDALSRLVGLFKSDSIGAVISAVRINVDDISDNAGLKGETLYQKHETLLRVYESKIYSTVNSLGTFYGMRTEMFRQIPNNLVCDDFFIILQSSLHKKRIIFDNQSIAMEVRSKSLSNELQRRIRTTAGGFSTLWINKALLNPKYGWVCFFLWSHKIMRWLSPMYLISLLIISFLFPFDSLYFQLLGVFQAGLYLSAIAGWILDKIKLNKFPFNFALYYVSINYGFLMGFIRFVRGQQNAIWERMDT